MNKNEEVRMKKEEKRMPKDFDDSKISYRESKKIGVYGELCLRSHSLEEIDMDNEEIATMFLDEMEKEYELDKG